MTWGWQPEPVVRLRPSYVDDGHGNKVPNWAAAVPAPIGNWLFAPATPAEELSGREHGVKVAGALYGPADADVQAGDAVTLTAGRFRIVGSPQVWRPGTVLEVERWDG